LALVTALLGSGQPDGFPQSVEKRRAWIEIELILSAVHGKTDRERRAGISGYLRLGRRNPTDAA